MKTKLPSFKPPEQRRSHRHHQHQDHHRHTKFNIFITIFFLVFIFFTYMFNRTTFISNISFNFNPNSTLPIPTNLFNNNNNQTFIINQLKSTSLSTSTIQNPVLIVKELIIQQSKTDPNPISSIIPPLNLTTTSRIKIPNLEFKTNLLPMSNSNQEFETRVQDFFKDCKVRFFMTWIASPFKFFGEREFIAIDALFKSNPHSCLIIVSNTMEYSDYGFPILKPVIDIGFRVLALEPDFNVLFDNTPAKTWFDHIKNGNHDPGEIPFAQNLSNIIRLVVLYKYGGVYLDTDFIILKDFSHLRNVIGAQSATRSGKWTRLNNAVMVFDKNHPLLYSFIKEFASTFDGNKWGYNGPYLVSRVMERIGERLEMKNISVLPPAAFYPVDWMRIGGLFRRPVNRVHGRWVEAKVVQLKEKSYGVHLWNKESRRLRIEEESIMARLISEHCVVCKSFKKNGFLNV